MHFQLIRDQYYNNIPRDLKTNVPDFRTSFTEGDEIYPILGEFGRFIINNINTELIVRRSSEFINHAIELGGSETEDAIVLQVFQPIYDNEYVIARLQPWLKRKALNVFLKFKDKYDQLGF